MCSFNILRSIQCGEYSTVTIIVVSSANGDVGMSAAIEILRAGGSALDAVEAATKLVELNEADHTVGIGGYPNALGQVELDASIMEGTTRRAGAVAALKDYPHPISVARSVMERLPQHAFLVGEGAARWARERGFNTADLLTPGAKQAWQEKMPTALQSDNQATESVVDIAAAGSAGIANEETRDLSSVSASSEKQTGTVNFLAIDAAGNIASAVSTSGWAFKYPGRVGDSPLIGAGNYCDSRYGACACTGLGEWAIRCATARTVVLAMQLGKTLDEACRFAMQDLQTAPLPDFVQSIMNFVALDANGNHAGYTTVPGRQYIWQTPEMAQFETAERTVIEA